MQPLVGRHGDLVLVRHGDGGDPLVDVDIALALVQAGVGPAADCAPDGLLDGRPVPVAVQDVDLPGAEQVEALGPGGSDPEDIVLALVVGRLDGGALAYREVAGDGGGA